jgi:hypothetical protein
VTNESDLIRRVAVRISLVALMLSAVAVVASPGRAVTQEQASDGLRFVVSCTQIGPAPESGGIGPVSCTLTVSGLPEPLEDQVSVVLFSADDAGDVPNDPAPSDTVVASEAPAIAPGAPVLVSRHLPIVPPLPPPISPQVPEPPPKSL